jgi:TetR/AcrR family transcriptional regulator, cholesterol catabolism regulator
VPRIAEARPPAEPNSSEQRNRHERILRAAAKHGTANTFERVQMHEVAKDAGVAIATLYRYFPSKTHLFTALLRAQVARLDELAPGGQPEGDPADAVADLLVRTGRRMLERPLLAQAMLLSNNASVSGKGPTGGVTTAFRDLIVKVAGLRAPSVLDDQLIRITEQAWYGILTSVLTGYVSAEEAAEDTVLACRRLLHGLGR